MVYLCEAVALKFLLLNPHFQDDDESHAKIAPWTQKPQQQQQQKEEE